MLPFTHSEFLDVFAAYNLAFWPIQPFAWLLGLVTLVAVVRGDEVNRRLALSLLALMWLWTGFAYHWLYFAAINPVAAAFGLGFVVQGLILGWLALRRSPPPRFSRAGGAKAIGGAIVIAYAGIVYPLLSAYLGDWPRTPSFGVTPCPVTLFTIGIFLMAERRLPPWLWLVPLIWSLIGGTAAFLLNVPQDWALLLSGVGAVLTISGRRRSAGADGIERSSHGQALRRA